MPLIATGRPSSAQSLRSPTCGAAEPGTQPEIMRLPWPALGDRLGGTRRREVVQASDGSSVVWSQAAWESSSAPSSSCGSMHRSLNLPKTHFPLLHTGANHSPSLTASSELSNKMQGSAWKANAQLRPAFLTMSTWSSVHFIKAPFTSSVLRGLHSAVQRLRAGAPDLLVLAQLCQWVTLGQVMRQLCAAVSSSVKWWLSRQTPHKVVRTDTYKTLRTVPGSEEAPWSHG